MSDGIPFVKMHGLGNDFMLVDARRRAVSLPPQRIRELADRRRGVGFDQLLLLEPAAAADADLRYRVFNADGGEVGQCGNGARCVGAYLAARGEAAGGPVVAEVAGGRIRLYPEADGRVWVEMGVPHFEPAAIPLDAPGERQRYELEVDGRTVAFGACSFGNPHAVIEVDDVAVAPVAALGAALEHHPAFPERVNVGFLQVVDRERLRLRVWERGVGETPACGSGACAAAVIAQRWGRVGERVTVTLPGGELEVHWRGAGEPVRLGGPATRVYEGRLAA